MHLLTCLLKRNHKEFHTRMLLWLNWGCRPLRHHPQVLLEYGRFSFPSIFKQSRLKSTYFVQILNSYINEKFVSFWLHFWSLSLYQFLVAKYRFILALSILLHLRHHKIKLLCFLNVFFLIPCFFLLIIHTSDGKVNLFNFFSQLTQH